MLPTVFDISNKHVVKISVNGTLAQAIQRMSESNLRTIIIENEIEKKYFILTTSKLLDFKITNVDKNTVLSDLELKECKALDKNLNLLTVLNHIEYSDDYMVIIENHELLGIVSYTDIVNNVDPQLLMEKQTISGIIHKYRAITTDKNASTLQAVEQMKEHDSDSIIIISPQMEPLGVFTTKDFIDIIHDDCDLSKPIKEFMTSPVSTLIDTSTISESMDYLKSKNHKRIVAVNSYGQLSGIITQKELLRIVYNKWVELIKEEGTKISKTNEKLLQATSELKEKISLDFLTKIYNRNKFEEILAQQIKLFKDLPTHNFSMILVDIDHFKKINDTYGHLAGDHVLQDIAKILSMSSRGSDIVARWGGEEFALLLPNTNLESAAIAAEKLRGNIENHAFENVNKITASFGVAHFHDSDSRIDFFKRADEALYRAKAHGRNKVELEHL